ncbi:MAG: hypothetical protein M1834_007482 [Cirrosporium novae-zelandiae]|nr:MAG: hypothetical protein M1834_007482 [Cirrosporium novae-zelandiae]
MKATTRIRIPSIMKRILGSLSKQRNSKSPNRDDESSSSRDDADSPEATIARSVRLFCESGSSSNAEEEVLHLPTIVDLAESSPSAAASAAQTIRTFLAPNQSKFHSKSSRPAPHVQYNAIMLIRILSDNPGPTFTRNMDAKFTSTVKELIHTTHDPSVQQIIRETLNTLETEKGDADEGLVLILNMWRKEKAKNPTPRERTYIPRTMNAPAWNPEHQPQFASYPHPPRGPRPDPHQVPPPDELAGRISEANTTAGLLMQLVQSTPPSAFDSNELIKEFAQRTRTARDSTRAYIQGLTERGESGEEETIVTLIETNEKLDDAISKYKKAQKIAKEKAEDATNIAGAMPPEQINSSSNSPGGFAPPPRQQENEQGDTDFFSNPTGLSSHQPLQPTMGNVDGAGGGYDSELYGNGNPPSTPPQSAQKPTSRSPVSPIDDKHTNRY